VADIETPRETREAVIRELYSQLEAIGWESMTNPQKTQQYSDWVDHPLIGGELADSMTAEGIRVWLKDVPLKEYTRALEGIGPCAQFARHRLTPASSMIHDALGSGWDILPGSVRDRPMHAVASDGSRTRYVCWGKPSTFRDLVWASIQEAAAGAADPLIIVFVRDGDEFEAKAMRERERIAAYCRFDLFHARRKLEAA
jgi:hypothetical protein